MNQKTIKRPAALAVALLVAVAMLASCGASSSDVVDASPSYRDEISNEAGGIDKSTAGSSGSEGLLGDYERKVIRTVTMSCETQAYDDAVSAIMSALSTHGGYVESSSATGTGYDDLKGSERRATYTLRIPAERLDTFLEGLRVDDGIRILSQEATSDEITATYYDTVSRLETLAAEKTSLTAMLEGFTDYSDISAMLKVQERLYNVIEEMEALQTQLNLYDGQVAMSTVNLTLREVITYTEVVEEEPTFGERIGAAFKESWTDFGEGCQDFAVWFVEAFPTLLVLGVIGGAVAVIVIKANKKSRQRREAQASNQTTAVNPKPPYRPLDKK